MATTLTKNLLHITFSTKNRLGLIPSSFAPELYAYIGGICRLRHSPLLAMGGTEDHVHMLVSLNKTVALSDFMLDMKRDSSKWVKEKGAGLDGFGWQDGYFAFSIGESGVHALRAYIDNQREHHKKIDFKDEIRALLRRYGIEWNEGHIWE
ncbi:MAG: IS200/IS605 family transposase [Phycisphaeraceae bacterium]|nr:IS200/IS605 family transposase [Phycisphaeraceae bacterium]